MIYQNINTESYRPSNYKVPLEVTKKWQNYIARDQDPSTYSYKQKAVLALAKDIYNLEQSGRTLFHMTTTYLPYVEREYSERDVNTFFINFYTKGFLPYVMGTKNYHTNSKKAIQPICYSFIDDHSMKPTKELELNFKTNEVYYDYHFADKLHHHSILAVHPDTLDKMNQLVGENTLKGSQFSKKIMTSDIKQCEPKRILYASKMYGKYPDFMSFPDSLTRHHSH